MGERRYRQAEERLWEAQGAQPTEVRTRLPRLGVDVRVQEVGDGPPVLFLHGGPNAGSTWAPLVARLEGFRCLLLDRPGTGLSDALPRPVDVARLADVLVADVLDALDVERADLVASSFGGYVALRSAAASPARVGAMVQMAAPALLEGQPMPGFMKGLVAPGLGRLITALPPTEGANRRILREIGHGASLDAGRIPQVFLDWYLALLRDTDTMRNERDLIRRVASLRGFDPTLVLRPEVLARVQAPTFFLWGADDAFGDEAAARRLVGQLPHATLEMVADAGHLPWLDDPVRAAAATGSFLRQHAGAEA